MAPSVALNNKIESQEDANRDRKRKKKSKKDKKQQYQRYNDQ